MADYFLCLDAELFVRRIRPALAESRRRGSFEPCRQLCASLLPAAVNYSQRYHIGDEQTLLSRVVDGLSFDRDRWRLLVGEVLLFAASEIPEFPTNAETLCGLLAPEPHRADASARASFVPIQQALYGSRDLTFGAAVYRPERAGYNDAADVARLAAYLAAVRPERWTIGDLRNLRDADDEERADELAFVREWFPVLVDFYQRTQVRGRVLVIESIY